MESHGQVSNESVLVAHERTYDAFKILIRWCLVAFGSSLVMLTLWFATPAGFFEALLAGIVLFVVGYYFVVRSRGSIDVGASVH